MQVDGGPMIISLRMEKLIPMGTLVLFLNLTFHIQLKIVLVMVHIHMIITFESGIM